MLRGLVARATTPLLPDDYLKLVNPLWSARELRGEVVSVERETEDSASVTIKPGWGFSGDYRPGQYVGIGLRIDGRWHWRSYSLTSIPQRDKKLISITVKATSGRLLVLASGERRRAPEPSSGWPHPKAISRCRIHRRRSCCWYPRAAASLPSWRCCVLSRRAARVPTSCTSTPPRRPNTSSSTTS